MKKNVFLLLLLFANIVVFSQQTLNWKIPSVKDFNDDTLKKYSKFHAVILQEEANLYFDEWKQELRLFYEVKRRIKILDTNGLKFTKIKLSYIGKENFEEFIELSGYVYRLENEEVVRKKIKRKNIKTVKKNDVLYQKIITFPKVKPGDIIELRYTLTSLELVNPRKWYFQHYDLPVVYSQFSIVLPDFIKYRINIKGDDNLILNKKEEERISIDYIFRYDDPIPPGLNYMPKNIVANMHFDFQGYRFTFAMKDQMPFQKEPFMDSPENYIRAANLFLVQVSQKTGYYSPFEQFAWEQLTRRIYQTTAWNYQIMSSKRSQFITYPSGFYVYTTSSWKDLDMKLFKSKDFGVLLSKYWNSKPILNEILKGKNTQLQKLIAIYDYVRQNIRWDSVYAVFPSDKPEKINKNKVGNSADINFLLISLLRAAKFEAYPVLVRTVDNGWIMKDYPSLFQFNTVIAGVYIDDNLILLDAIDKNRPWFVLDEKDLNGEGRLLKNLDGKWVALRSPVKSSLHIDGLISFDQKNVSYNLNLFYRGRALNDTDKIFVKKFKIDQNVKQKDSLTYFANVSFSTGDISVFEVQREDDDSILGFTDLKLKIFNIFNLSNPFKAVKRMYPIYFGEPFEVSYSLKIKYDLQSWTLTKIPENFAAYFDGGRIIFRVNYDENFVYLEANVMIDNDFYPPENYKKIRQAFEKLSYLRYQAVEFSYNVM